MLNVRSEYRLLSLAQLLSENFSVVLIISKTCTLKNLLTKTDNIDQYTLIEQSLSCKYTTGNK